MKCPKCQYIGFDSGERCRNCGYEFSLTVDIEALDLRMQTGDEPLGPLEDFLLSERDLASRPAAAAPAAEPGATRRVGPGSSELPLFGEQVVPDDAPLVTPGAAPRAPLSVRRSAPVPPRARARRDPSDAAFDLELPEVEDRVSPSERHPALAPADPPFDWSDEKGDDAGLTAAALPRLAAAGIDALILGAINLAVLYLTLQVMRLEFQDAHLLSRLPMAGFLLLLTGGYFVLFTAAGGQTIGKMAMAIRVVAADPSGRTPARVPLRNAVIRAAGYAVSLLPLGLGYLPALIGQERRAIHDRLADTRVIKA